MATDGLDGNGLQLKRHWPIFLSLSCASKRNKKHLIIMVCSSSEKSLLEISSLCSKRNFMSEKRFFVNHLSSFLFYSSAIPVQCCRNSIGVGHIPVEDELMNMN